MSSTRPSTVSPSANSPLPAGESPRRAAVDASGNNTADSPTDAPARKNGPDPFRWVVENPGTVDLIVFASLTIVVAIFALLTGAAGGMGSWWALFTLPMVALGAICRQKPGLAITLIAILAVTHVACNMAVVGGDVMTFYALYCAVAYGRPRTHIAAVILGFLGVLVQAGYWSLTIAFFDPYGSLSSALIMGAILTVGGSASVIAVWALGRLQKARLLQLRMSRDRAEQAVREREHRTALAVADERARIAREMHDVVAHSLSVIIAQADGGRFIASQKPEKAVEVLSTIGDTGRAALADMRSLLGVLRADEETTFGPQPGIDRVPELIERVRAAGLPTSLDLGTVQAEQIPQAMSLSLFRLVQEALTNVMKHAGPGASAQVRIRHQGGQLEVDVIDDGQGVDPDSDGMGHGVTGMRERVALFGGTLEAGPLPGRGFRVRATLPLPGGADAPSASPALAQNPYREDIPAYENPVGPYSHPSSLAQDNDAPPSHPLTLGETA